MAGLELGLDLFIVDDFPLEVVLHQGQLFFLELLPVFFSEVLVDQVLDFVVVVDNKLLVFGGGDRGGRQLIGLFYLRGVDVLGVVLIFLARQL